MLQQALCTQYTNNNVVAIEFSKNRNPERSTSRILFRLITCAYIKARESRQRAVVRIQSALCEVACEEYSRGLKIAVSAYENRSVKKYCEVSNYYCIRGTSLNSGT